MSYVSPIDPTTPPFLDVDTVSNRVMLYADKAFYTTTSAEMENIPRIDIYFNERLYNLFVGLPYIYMTKSGDLNYRLNVTENIAGSFQRTVTDLGQTLVNGVVQPTILTETSNL